MENVSTGIYLPKCKSDLSRKLSLDILIELIKHSSQNLAFLIEDITALVNNAKDIQVLDRDYDHESLPNHGYVGLLNQGCTCYMNSILQQIYYVKPFSQAVIDFESLNENQDDDLFYQLKVLFSQLSATRFRYYDPISFVRTVKNPDGRSVDVREQMDAQEFFNSLLDSVERKVKGTEVEKLVSTVFSGKLKSQIVSLECEHKSERFEEFLSIGIDIKNQKSISDGMVEFFKTEKLDGGNKYHCEKCSR